MWNNLPSQAFSHKKQETVVSDVGFVPDQLLLQKREQYQLNEGPVLTVALRTFKVKKNSPNSDSFIRSKSQLVANSGTMHYSLRIYFSLMFDAKNQ